jgi:hypothetical protein
VRDAASARALPDEYNGNAAIVLDTAVDISRLWDAASLSDSFGEFLRRKSLTRDDALLCVHIRPGGRGKHAPPSLAAAIERFATARGMIPVLLSVAPSLGDGDTLRAVSRCLASRHVLADDAVLLKAVAAVISGSRAYIGNSLHGYITAAVHGVPGVIVARPGFAKFAGFAEQIGRAADVSRDWDSGLDRLAATLASGARPLIEPALHRRLDWHWQAVADAIARPEVGRARRAALLSHLGRNGHLLDALGPLKTAFAASLRDSGANQSVADARRP